MPISWGTQTGTGFPGLITNLTVDQIPADYGMDPEIINDPAKYDDNGLVNNVTGKTNFEVVVYPGATHVFDEPSEKPRDFLGHHYVYDEKATQDAQQRADTFMAAHMK